MFIATFLMLKPGRELGANDLRYNCRIRRGQSDGRVRSMHPATRERDKMFLKKSSARKRLGGDWRAQSSCGL